MGNAKTETWDCFRVIGLPLIILQTELQSSWPKQDSMHLWKFLKAASMTFHSRFQDIAISRPRGKSFNVKSTANLG
jgi:hypothetical protein